MRYGRALLEVEKPGRYEGLEAGAVVKDWGAARCRVALCFPDVYEIGMSHLGLPILYAAVNGRDGLLAERAYAPWHDMEALLRARGWPLVTRESGRALREFDLVGFTLPYELVATNVLAMLDLGGVPLLAADRGQGDPLVLGGGPVAANPEPLADFFDALFIGEAEEGLVEAVEAVAAAGPGRADRLDALAGIDGVYVPSRVRPRYRGGRFDGFDPAIRVRRRLVPDLDGARPPARPLVPFISTVHERLAVEIARGCTRGCRFCQAGYLYRPVRERAGRAVCDLVRDGLGATGFDEVGLLSLSTGDYTGIGPLLVSLMDEHAGDRVSVSLPSLRVDSLEPRLLEEVRRVRRTGFTVAPEAGTARLRAVINKNVSEEEILGAARRIFDAGWKAVKLYFMVGLPYETQDDRQGIVDLVRRVAAEMPAGRGRVTVSLSNFVPKAHTPFQWVRQIGLDEIREIQGFFRERLQRVKRVELKWHDARLSALEGVIARGDRRVGAAVLAAYRLGCRMDSWTSELRWDAWQEALAGAGLDLAGALAARDPDGPLPWDGVDVGLDPGFLRREWERAGAGAATADCRDGNCHGCGLCDFDRVRPRTGQPLAYPPPSPPPVPDEPDPPPRLRLRFSKVGPASLLAHLETVAALHRALRAAGVPIVYSRGFHPQPRMTLGPALPLGTESLAEVGDVKVREVPPLAEIQRRANQHLPEGLRIEAVWVLPPDTKGLTGGGTREEYRVTPTPEADRAAAGAGGWDARVASFWAAAPFQVVKRRKHKKDRVLDAREFVEGLWRDGADLVVRVRRRDDGTTVGPEDLVHALAGLPDGVRAAARVVKERSDR